MRVGKVKESILKRSVLRQVKRESISVQVQVHPVEGWTLAAPRAVYGAVNAVAASGALPSALALTILMPEDTEEKQLKELMKDINRLCLKEKVALVSGHTAVSRAVTTLVLAVTGIGESRTFGDGRLGDADHVLNRYDDMDILMVGHAGREGAALLAIEKEEELKERYAPSYIDTAKYFYEDAGLVDAAGSLYSAGAKRIHAIREGGVFGALWELAALTKTGLSVDLKKIPIRQHTIEICEYFDLNPYMLLSGGCLLALCPDGEKALYDLKEIMDIDAGIIGRTTSGNDRLIHYDRDTRYLEPPNMDEIYKVRPRPDSRLSG